MVGLARSFPLPETGNVPGLRAACHRTGRVVFRQCAHRDRASLCPGSTSHAAPSLCLPHSPFFRLPSFRLACPVFRRWCSGDTPVILRCISEVDSKIPCVCRTLAALAARCNRSAAFAAYSTRIEYCWPVNGPDWASRGRLRNFAPAAIRASRCSWVNEWLYFCEAAPKRARSCSCLGVLGSWGLR
jgi:hypothetical protein